MMLITACTCFIKRKNHKTQKFVSHSGSFLFFFTLRFQAHFFQIDTN
jgi:hypothetical protein